MVLVDGVSSDIEWIGTCLPEEFINFVSRLVCLLNVTFNFYGIDLLSYC